MKDAREGRGKEGFNKKKHDEGYMRAFYTCTNKECPRRLKCFRYLKTPNFERNSEKFIPQENGECEWFVEDRKET